MTAEAYEYFRQKGHALAGEADDFRMRATLYHRMYQESGGRHVFALVAAHGALWAAGYFSKGALGVWLLSLRYLLSPRVRRARLAAVTELSRKLREINRQVCAESYALFHYTRQFGATRHIRSVMGDDFAELLCASHASYHAGSSFTADQRERLFAAFFMWEQQTIVASLVTDAFEHIDWPVLTYFALRPRIDFSYFGRGFHVQFADFRSLDERVLHGMQAYRRAEEAGLAFAEQCLGRYKLSPYACDTVPEVKEMTGSLSWSTVKPLPDTAAVPGARSGTAARSMPVLAAMALCS